MSDQNNGYKIVKADVDEALNKSNGTSNPKMTDQERFIIAHHEMGHALAAYVLPHSTAIERIVVGSERKW